MKLPYKQPTIINRQVSIIVFTLFSISLLAQSSIQRVEPPNWWTGMQHHRIQVMVYGQDIGLLHPSLDYPGVQLEKAVKTPNPNYLFLYLNITPEAKPGEIALTFSRKGEIVATHNYPLQDRKADRKKLQGFTPADAIYLITPDRFANGNSDNDYVEGMRERPNRSDKGGRHGGDIAGIQQHLDYIQNLGFTAVWLNPLLENDMSAYSYHGYATTDFYRVDPRFGSNEAYLQLADELRRRDMKLIMDMIVNHCGSEHWWMNDLPTPDWINQWPVYTETSHRKTVLQDPYASEADHRVFTDGWFVPTMPDLNQRNELLAQYLIQNSIWWVEYLGLAGIRMDTYPYPDMDFMSAWTEAVMREYPGLNIVGEEWFEDPAVVSYWQKGKQNPNGYTSELKSLMDFPVQQILVKALNQPEKWKSGWIELYEMIARDFLYADPYNLVVFPDNHDISRMYTQLNEDRELLKLALAFTLTTRGIPQIYYGTEILMSNKGTSDHGIIRSDFPGGWAGDEVNAFRGNGLSEEQKEVKAWLQKLLNWRKGASAIHQGRLLHFLPRNGLYVYFRYDEQQKVMVVLNKNENDSPLGLDRFAEVIQDARSGKNVLSGETYSLGAFLQVPARSALILELE